MPDSVSSREGGEKQMDLRCMKELKWTGLGGWGEGGAERGVKSDSSVSRMDIRWMMVSFSR